MPPAVPSSTRVFHSPQASHLPAQRDVTLPQDWQMNWTRGLAIKDFARLGMMAGVVRAVDRHGGIPPRMVWKQGPVSRA